MRTLLITATLLTLIVLPALYARFGRAAVSKATVKAPESVPRHLKAAE